MNNIDNLSLAFKITNWCDLQCAICPTDSKSATKKNMLPIDSVRKYTTEFRNLDIPTTGRVIFSGGEPFVPVNYIKNCYIPTCLEIAFQSGLQPVIQTNGMWGTTKAQADSWLIPMANTAKQYNARVNLNMAFDKYHANQNALVSVISTVLQNPLFAEHIKLELIGRHSHSMRALLNALVTALDEQELNPRLSTADNSVYISKPQFQHVAKYSVPYTFFNTDKDIRSAHNGDNIIRINNDNTVQLNNAAPQPTQGKDLRTLIAEIQNIRTK